MGKRSGRQPTGTPRRGVVALAFLVLAIVAATGWFLASVLPGPEPELRAGPPAAERGERAAADPEARTAAEPEGRAAAEPESPLAATKAAASGASATVRMTNSLVFEPKALEIRVGETVRWENTSDVPHTVTADPDKTGNPDQVRLPRGAEPFDSGLLEAGEAFSRTFTVPGEYRYFCIPHQMANMVGTVVVRP